MSRPHYHTSYPVSSMEEIRAALLVYASHVTTDYINIHHAAAEQQWRNLTWKN